MGSKECENCIIKDKITEKYRKLLYATKKSKKTSVAETCIAETSVAKTSVAESSVVETFEVKTYEKREGVVDLGKEYEYLTCALCALKFCTSDEIDNFCMTTNNKTWDKFDDIEIDANFKSGQATRFLYQLKMTTKNDLMAIDMSADGKTFRKNEKIYLMNFINLVGKLKKLEKHKEKLTFYLLYTNFNTSLKNGDTFTNKKNHVTLMAKEVEMCCKELLLGAPEAKVFQFKPQTNDSNPETEEACKHFYIICGQPNIEETRIKIKTLLRTLFHIYIYEYYEQFIRNWWQNNIVLNRDIVIAKLVEFILSPYIKTISERKCNTKTANIEKVMKNFDIILVEEDKKEIACHIWSECSKCEPNSFFDVAIVEEATSLQKAKLLWHLGKAPLVVNAEDLEEDVLKSVLTILEKSTRKNIVLIGQIKNLNTEKLKTFKNLLELKMGERYPSFIEELTVSIQGKKLTTLGNLLLQDENGCLTFSVRDLLLMTQDDNFQIGEEGEKVSSNYVNRRLSICVIETRKLVQFDDVVIISCKKPFSEELQRLFYGKQNVAVIDSDTSSLNEHFDEECKRNQEANVYGFQQIDEKFCALTLKQECNFQHQKFCFSEQEVGDNEIVNKLYGCFLNIFCGPPGTGKSELMIHLCNNTDPNVWSIKINLIHYNTFLATNPTYEAMKTKFLHQNENDYLVQQTKSLLLMKRKLYLFIDGLDEVTSSYVNSVLDFVKKITSEGVRVWISTREHLCDQISHFLKIVPIKIEHFNQDEEILYIRKKLDPLYKKKQLDDIQKILSENMVLRNCREILGAPLLLHIITETLLNSKQAYNSLKDQNVIALTKIFKLYFVEKVKTIYQKLDIDETEMSQLGNQPEDRLNDYEIPALKLCLENVDFRKLNIDLNETEKFLAQAKREGDKFGIIKKLDGNDTAIFYHKTYAEYFACVWFKKRLKEKGSLIMKMLFQEKYKDLRRMFDSLMAENNPLHLAVVYNNPVQFEKYLFQLSETDEGGRTAAHLVFSYGENYNGNSNCKSKSECIVAIMASLLKKQFDINCKDRLLEANPLEYAAFSNCLYCLEKYYQNRKFNNNNMIKKVMSQCADEEALIKYVINNGYSKLLLQLLQFHPYLMTIKFEGNSLLHIAVLKENNEIILKLLIKLGIQFDVYNNEKETLLYLATKKKLLSNIKVLLEMGASPCLPAGKKSCAFFLACCYQQAEDEIINVFTEFLENIDFRDDNGNTAFIVACEKGAHTENLRVLMKKGADIHALNNSKRNALHCACLSIEPNQEIIEFLLDQSFDIDARDSNGCTPFLLVCESGCIKNAEILIEKKADIYAVNNYKRNALHCACCSSRLNNVVIELLLNYGFDTETRDSEGSTSFLLVCEKGCIENAKILMEKKADIYALDNNKRNALHYACGSDKPNTETIELLIDYCFDIETIDDSKLTPLLIACEQNCIENVKTLLKKGANVNALNGWRENALHRACLSSKANTEILELLVNYGCSINMKDIGENTPFLIACKQGYIENVKLLMVKKPDVYALNNFKHNALHCACDSDKPNTKVIELLLDHGFDVNSRTNTGYTPLLIACEQSCLENVKMLLDKGANVNSLNNLKQNALHRVCYSNRPNTEVTELLISKGCKINARDTDGYTPLLRACKNGCLDNVKFLVMKGADVHSTNNYKHNALDCAQLSFSSNKAATQHFLIQLGLKSNKKR